MVHVSDAYLPNIAGVLSQRIEPANQASQANALPPDLLRSTRCRTRTIKETREEAGVSVKQMNPTLL